MRKVTEKGFLRAVGHLPAEDDMERTNCTLAGRLGHYNCGWCKEHQKPRFICGCIYRAYEQQEKWDKIVEVTE